MNKFNSDMLAEILSTINELSKQPVTGRFVSHNCAIVLSSQNFYGTVEYSRGVILYSLYHQTENYISVNKLSITEAFKDLKQQFKDVIDHHQNHFDQL